MRRPILLPLLATLVSAALTACSPFTLLNLQRQGDVESRIGVTYGKDERHKLDVYTPKHARGSSPVVVFFYGGNWRTGSRDDYAFVGRTLASRGIVTVTADYRLYPEVRYPLFLEDAAQAVHWTYTTIHQYGGSSRSIYLMGHSAGAYNAAMLALDSRWLSRHGMTPSDLCGWIGLAGPYNFLPITNEETKPVFSWPDTPPSSQPISHASSSAPPALLIAARHDTLVDPVQNTQTLAMILQEKNVAVDHAILNGIGHSTLIGTLAAPLSYFWPTLNLIEGFVRGGDAMRARECRVLKGSGSAL